MQSKACIKCSKVFYKTPNLSQKYWEEKRLYCSNRCKVLGTASPKKGKQYPHLWKDGVKYGQLHMRVRKLFGKAKKCAKCSSEKNVQWANKSNKYIDANDFIELCASCHKIYDIKMNGRIVWNKGKKGLQTAWNKGLHVKLNPKGEFKKGNIPWNKKERKMIFCKCGCGEMLMNINQYGHGREYIFRHFYKSNSVEK